jgi:hypothetical protein
MSSSEQKPVVVVNKVESAGREIETAIWLWFNEGDTVSIHTLADAAWGVILDIYHVRKWKWPIPFDNIPKGKGDNAPKKLMKKIREAGTYGKHARHDHHLDYEYNEIFIESYLASAVAAYGRLREPKRDGLLTLFSFWFAIRNPTLVEFLPVIPESLDVERIRQGSRTEYFREHGGYFVGNPPSPEAMRRDVGFHLP